MSLLSCKRGDDVMTGWWQESIHTAVLHIISDTAHTEYKNTWINNRAGFFSVRCGHSARNKVRVVVLFVTVYKAKQCSYHKAVFISQTVFIQNSVLFQAVFIQSSVHITKQCSSNHKAVLIQSSVHITKRCSYKAVFIQSSVHTTKQCSFKAVFIQSCMQCSYHDF